MRIEVPIPSRPDWERVTARRLFERVRREPRERDGIVTAFRDGQVTLRSNRRVEGFTNAVEEVGYQGVSAGDLVIHSMDGFAGAIGVSDSDGKASPVVHCYVPTPDADPRYYAHLLRVLAQRGFITSLAKGIRERSTAFDVETFRSLLLPHPRLAEQRAIADYLDAETARIDALIAKKQQLIHLLEERWETELTELLRLDGDLIALQRLFEPTIGGSWGSEPGTADKDAACVRGTDFDMRALRVAATCPKRSYTIGDFASKCLRPGDLVIEKSGGGENQPVGRAVLFDGSGPAVPTNFAARLRPRAGSVPDYLILLLNAAYRQGITRSWIKQTTGIQNLDLGGLLSEKVPLPSKTRQLELLVQLKQRDERRRSVVGQLSRQIDLLAEHRQTLITAAVTGQLSVPGAA